ncbi:YkvA family protein [Halobacillus sp. Marseille-Q1614]|uniref:YkvA family protein n=1 Tax=Halobacillus sp. Marseille-Q1614 TaxID=2709134 RepID=UPI00156F24AC|nr:YkvA family protein [Halobacillus sp. Marseille-Q1614]
MQTTEKKKARQLFDKLKENASDLVNQPEKARVVLKQGIDKAFDNEGPLAEVWHDLQLMFAMVRDWIRGNYDQAPKRSITAILGGILYLVVPIDAIPDFIPIAGLVDDVYVLNLVIKQVRTDLNDYNLWLMEQDDQENEEDELPES